MSKVDLEGTGTFRIELPRVLWEGVKSLSPWVGKPPKKITEEALWEYLEKHNAVISMEGKKVIDGGEPVPSTIEELTSADKEKIVVKEVRST